MGRHGLSITRVAGACYLLIAAAFVGTSVYVLAVASWTVISFDQWRIYDGYFSRGFLPGLLASQNGHHPILPGILSLLDINFFGAHNYLLNVTGIVLAVVSACLWSRLILRDRELLPLQRLLAIGILWIFVFWLANRRVLGHGNESLHVYLLVCGFFLAWWAVVVYGPAHRETEMRAVLLGCLGCSVATFSYGTGIITWLVVIALACFSCSRRAPIMISAVFTAHIAFYVAGFSLAGGGRRLAGFAPLAALLDAATWLGSPSFHILSATTRIDGTVLLNVICPALGLLGVSVALCAVVSAVRKGRKVSELESWCAAVLAFCSGSALLVALGRQAYFDNLPEQRVAPRYLPWACLFWVAALVFLALGASRGRTRFAMGSWTVVLFALPVLLAPSHTGRDLESAKYGLEHAAVGLSLGIHDAPTVTRLFRRPEVVFRVAEALKERKVAMFDWPIADQLGKRFADLYRTVEVGDSGGAAPSLSAVSGGEAGDRIFGGVVTRPRAGFSDLVVVDRHGIITGGGLIRGTGHGWARRLGLLARTSPRYIGYTRHYIPEDSYRFFAVDLEDRTAFLLTAVAGPSTLQSEQGEQGGRR